MNTYRLNDGDVLVFSVNGTPWETITFEAKDFQDIQAATAEELAGVLNKSGSLAASVDEQGALTLATAAAGGHTSLEIDLARSSAAGPLGLVSGQEQARGEGLRAARLVSLAAEPFALPLGAIMTVVVDGQRRKVSFGDGITGNQATADEVARVINAKRKKIADPSRDGRVILTSTTVGAGSRLMVEPGRSDQGETDAAAILGFVGTAAFDQPHRLEPARIVCSGQSTGLQVVNLTASPVELHFSSSTAVLPARASLPLAPGDAASSQLQRLIGQGVVRLMAAKE